MRTDSLKTDDGCDADAAGGNGGDGADCEDQMKSENDAARVDCKDADW